MGKMWQETQEQVTRWMIKACDDKSSTVSTFVWVLFCFLFVFPTIIPFYSLLILRKIFCENLAGVR